jgi:hypothetical protein
MEMSDLVDRETVVAFMDYLEALLRLAATSDRDLPTFESCFFTAIAFLAVLPRILLI